MCYINYLETLINYNGMHLQKKLKLTFSSMKRKSKINVTTETCILDETENILQMINPMRLPTCKQNIFFKLFYNRCNDFLLYIKKKRVPTSTCSFWTILTWTCPDTYVNAKRRTRKYGRHIFTHTAKMSKYSDYVKDFFVLAI